MSEGTGDPSEAIPSTTIWPEQLDPEPGKAHRRRRWLNIAAASTAVVALAGGAVWLTRERIANNLITNELKRLGLPATYRIESIGPRRQVLSHVVIGDPRAPDLTVDQVIVAIRPRLGFPTLGRVTLVRPRLHGRWEGASISFGSLDAVLFRGKRTEPFRLPDLDVAIREGSALIDGDHGAVSLRLDGAGRLRGGFAGTVAADTAGLLARGCALGGAQLRGRISVASEQPGLSGPLQVKQLTCQAGGLRITDSVVALDLKMDRRLDGVAGKIGFGTGAVAWAATRSSGLNGAVSGTWRGGALTAQFDGLSRGMTGPQVAAATLAARGTLRARDGFGRVEVDGGLDGSGLRLGEGSRSALVAAERTSAGTFVAPLLQQLRAALDREAPGSRVAGDFVFRRNGAQVNAVVPRLRVTGRSGAALLAVSRLRYATGAEGRSPRLAANFTTGGAGLPQVTGRMEGGTDGTTRVRIAMAEYRAGPSRLAVPQLLLAQDRDGALRFSGVATASGPLPGGRAENLTVPVLGTRTAGGALRLWPGCTTVQFDALAYADLQLDGRAMRLCPGPGGAIVRSQGARLVLAVGTPSLDLAGTLGGTPIRIAAGPVGFAMPGSLFAKDLDVALGPPATAARLHLADLKASIGREVGGTFGGTDGALSAVPLDLREASGTWRYSGGRLAVSDARFRLEDRAQVDRFEPLVSEGASLELANSRITAAAVLRQPATGRDVVATVINHDLGTGRGRADLTVPSLVFDDKLQPDMLSRQLLGVVANARGTVRGKGQFTWDAAGVRSSGDFGSDSLDFAAAFGPVKGAAGTVHFTDLVNFTTAPHQRLAIASINPGIEATGGEVRFQLRPGSQLAVEGAEWPFLGGRLMLRPVKLAIGVAETRRYVLDIEGLDAARFVAQMELANLSATGTFDGSLPLVFDENGGRIDGGLLTSRPPGGNVAYVGALTYKDLSTMANFAFDALRSLDYRQMRIAMDGALEGELVTRVRFDGVKQGAGAKRNFITRRLANLPLQFNVNVRAPFYSLISSFKSMYDPAYVKDPRTLGLIDANGRPLPAPPASRPAPPPASGGIQSPASENKP